MKINELRRYVKQYNGWVIRTDGESYGSEEDSRWRTVYIVSKRFVDGNAQVRLRSHSADALVAIIDAIEESQ